MLTKIKAWFFGLFKSAEHDLALAATKAHFDEVIVDMREHFNRAFQAAVADLSSEYKKLHQDTLADLKKYIGSEIAARYDSLVADAGKAARLLEHSKIVMALCDYCHLPNRRFSLSRVDGKTVCATCAAKGIN